MSLKSLSEKLGSNRKDDPGTSRNLHLLLKSRNDSAWNFTQGVKKARKILDVVQTLQEQFPQTSGTRPGGRILPYVLSGLIATSPFIGLFNGKAQAESTDSGIEVALNSKTPTLQEGLGKEAPVSLKAPEKQKEAWMEAQDWSLTHPGVAIAVYGHADDASTKQIGEFLVARLAEKGIDAVYYLAKEDRRGASVAFFLKGLSYGPGSLDDAPQNLQEVFADFPGAWPDSLAQAQPINSK